jgi:hypothetical protein
MSPSPVSPRTSPLSELVRSLASFGSRASLSGQLWTPLYQRHNPHALPRQRASASLVKMPSDARRVWWRRALAWLKRALFGAHFVDAPLPPPGLDVDRAKASMIAAHGYLAFENLQSSLLWPAWTSTLPELARVGQVGFVASLAVSGIELSGDSPENFGAGLEVSRAADALALHLALERAVAELSARGVAAPIGPVEAARATGGLRSAALLPTWRRIARPLAAARRTESSPLYRLRLWAQRSPLTLLVYFDLLFPKEAVPWQALLQLEPLDPPAPATERRFWIAELARSLLGALLSGPPANEEYVEAKLRRQRLAARLGPDAQRSGAYRSALENEQRLAREVSSQLRARVAVLAASLNSAPELHLCLAYLLVNHLTGAATADIERRLQSRARDGRRASSGPEGVLWPDTQAEPEAFQHFYASLFGDAPFETFSKDAALGDQLLALAPKQGATTTPTSSLHQRFFNEPVVLAVHGLEPSATPDRILHQWIEHLIKKLPRDAEEASVSAVQV